jgi:6-phospho-beta-glucosidase
MKIAIIGAGGLRTPLVLRAIARRAERLGLEELALMDPDGRRLGLMAALAAAELEAGAAAGDAALRYFAQRVKVRRGGDVGKAVEGADFVVSTFRVGGMEGRVADERVALGLGLLGQETTGPGGFAMAMRTIPVLFGLIDEMERRCPGAWLVNFANPSGLLTEAARNLRRYEKTVGICDAPSSLAAIAAIALGERAEDIALGYFGLNHLGWVRSVKSASGERLPELIAMLEAAGGIPGYPFPPSFVRALGMLPNEYLYYYYFRRASVENMLAAKRTRGESLLAENEAVFRALEIAAAGREGGDAAAMAAAYSSYLEGRLSSYMRTETGEAEERPSPAGADPGIAARLGAALDALAEDDEGYAGVALGLIEALSGQGTRRAIVNVPNAGAISGVAADAVVEVPALVGKAGVEPLAQGEVPEACLGLMLQVKAYERLTARAAVEGSRALALQALVLHPLVGDIGLAERLLSGYVARHGSLFPALR